MPQQCNYCGTMQNVICFSEADALRCFHYAGGKPGKEQANHPQYYGGADNPYEAIKVIEAWFLNFNLGNCVKYVSRAGKKGDALTDLKKARWYLDREINTLEKDSS